MYVQEVQFTSTTGIVAGEIIQLESATVYETQSVGSMVSN